MVCVLAIGILAALELFLSYAQYGQAMRAVAQDMQGASMVGINVNQIFSYAFGLSVALAGIAGILLAPIYLISPLGGWPPFLKAFVIVVFGGLGSTRGVFYSAFILAIIEFLRDLRDRCDLDDAGLALDLVGRSPRQASGIARRSYRLIRKRQQGSSSR